MKDFERKEERKLLIILLCLIIFDVIAGLLFYNVSYKKEAEKYADIIIEEYEYLDEIASDATMQGTFVGEMIPSGVDFEHSRKDGEEILVLKIEFIEGRYASMEFQLCEGQIVNKVPDKDIEESVNEEMKKILTCEIGEDLIIMELALLIIEAFALLLICLYKVKHEENKKN